MRRIMLGTVITFFLAFNLCSGSVTFSKVSSTGINVSSDDFYDFSLDYAHMDATSPANVGSFLLDGNAYAITKSGTQFIRNGSRYKFFGSNYSYADNVPSHAYSDYGVDYLAFFGFNAMRFHHMDNFYPLGVLENDGTSQTMSTTGMDNLDYLVSKLKAKGIYLDLGLKVSRPFKEVGDSVTSYSQIPGGLFGRGYDIFDARLIALQKDYANKLLGHTNDYTSIAYKDDPIVAMVEINNEDRWITDWWDTGVWDRASTLYTNTPAPEFYLDELDDLWNTWLAAHYTAPSDVITAWGLTGLSYEPGDDYYYIKAEKDLTTFTFHRPYGKVLAYYPAQQVADITAFMHNKVTDYCDTMKTYLTSTLGVDSLILTVGGGQSYFTETESEAYSDVHDCHTYFDPPGVSWSYSNFSKTNARMLTDANLGMVNVHNTKEEATKTKPFTVTEYGHVYPSDYQYEGNLMMAIYGLEYDWDGIWLYNFGTASSTSISNYFDIANNPQQMLLSGLGAYIFQKATNYTVTNYGTYLVFTSDQVCCALGSIAGRAITLNGYTMTPAVDGVVAIYSATNQSFAASDKLVVLTVAKWKNTGAYWDVGYVGVAGHFHWGTVPSQLQRVGTSFSIPYAAGQKVYRLDNKGSVSTEVAQTINGSTATFDTTGIDCPWYVIDR